MEEKEMNEALLASFPELKAEFDEYTSWQDGIETGAFLTYEDVLLPHIVDALKNNETQFLARAAQFIEEGLTQKGQYCANVIYVGVLEGLKSKCDNSKVRDFCFDVARKEFDELVYQL